MMKDFEENVYRIAESLHVPERKIIDFSVPVNPLGVSKKIKAELRKRLKYLGTLPDPDCLRMRRHLARIHQVEISRIVCGHDSLEIILRISAVLKPRSVLIPVPSFPGYERAVAGDFLSSPRELTPEVKYFFLKEDDGFATKAKEFIDALKGCDLALLCNPHYPTGGMLEREEMVTIARAAEMNGCHLIIDETFLDFVPAESTMSEMNEFSRIMVVKSLGYYNSLLGLGAAYGILPRDISSPVLAAVPCPPGDLNQRASVVALKDKVYKKETAHVLAGEKAFLETELRKCDIAYLPSRANFYLLKISDAPQLCDFLLSRHILAGRCDNYRGLDNRFLRISVRNHRENALLVKALREFRTRENSM